ncbi:unnamed protein product [Anisakis simplex]|uniref:Oxidored_FMN domain-containing protein n=1 Tax=Anisakis simplex TaxID=6269 RepID=A0A158PNX7_ANISI|nr:unnamed protein product [Anisakis simplex]
MFSDGAQAQLSEPITRWESADGADQSVLAQRLRFPYASNVVAPNRFMKSAMSEQLATFEQNDMQSSGIPTRELTHLYEKFADGGFGIVVTGAIMVNQVIRPLQKCDGSFDKKDLEAPGNVIIDQSLESEDRRVLFEDWTKTAKKNGSVFLAQLYHPGNRAANLPNKVKFDASTIGGKRINALIDEYVYAATFAQQCGFDGVEISCAYHSALEQFIDANTNKRSDDYGESLQNRTRLLFQIIHAIRLKVQRPSSFVIGVKLSSGSFEKDYKEEEFEQFIRNVEKTGFDYIAISGGHFYLLKGMHGLDSKSEKHEKFYQTLLPIIKRNLTRTKLYMNGGFVTLADMCEAITDRWAAGVSLGRPVAAEPGLPKKLLDGEVKGAVKSLIDPLDSATSQDIAGTQLWQHAWQLPVMDASNPEHLEQFKKDLAAHEEKKAAAEIEHTLPIVGYPKTVLCAEHKDEHQASPVAVSEAGASVSEHPKGEDEIILLDSDAKEPRHEEDNVMTEEYTHHVVKKQLDNADAPSTLHENTVEDILHTVVKRSKDDEYESFEITEETIEKVTRTDQVYAEPPKDGGHYEGSPQDEHIEITEVSTSKEHPEGVESEIVEKRVVHDDAAPPRPEQPSSEETDGLQEIVDNVAAKVEELAEDVTERVEEIKEPIEEVARKVVRDVVGESVAEPETVTEIHAAIHESAPVDESASAYESAPAHEAALAHEVSTTHEEAVAHEHDKIIEGSPADEIVAEPEITKDLASDRVEPVEEAEHISKEQQSLDDNVTPVSYLVFLNNDRDVVHGEEQPTEDVLSLEEEIQVVKVGGLAEAAPVKARPEHDEGAAKPMAESEAVKAESLRDETADNEQIQKVVLEKEHHEIGSQEEHPKEEVTEEKEHHEIVSQEERPKEEVSVEKEQDELVPQEEHPKEEVSEQKEHHELLSQEEHHEEKISEDKEHHELVSQEEHPKEGVTEEEQVKTEDSTGEHPDKMSVEEFIKKELSSEEQHPETTILSEQEHLKEEMPMEKHPKEASEEECLKEKVLDDEHPQGVSEEEFTKKEVTHDEQTPAAEVSEHEHLKDKEHIEEIHLQEEHSEKQPEESEEVCVESEAHLEGKGREKETSNEIISGLNAYDEPLISGIVVEGTGHELRPEPEGAVTEEVEYVEAHPAESTLIEEEDKMAKVDHEPISEQDQQHSTGEMIVETVAAPIGSVIEEHVEKITKIVDQSPVGHDAEVESDDKSHEAKIISDGKLTAMEEMKKSDEDGSKVSDKISDFVGGLKEHVEDAVDHIEETASKITTDLNEAVFGESTEQHEPLVGQQSEVDGSPKRHGSLFGSSAESDKPTVVEEATEEHIEDKPEASERESEFDKVVDIAGSPAISHDQIDVAEMRHDEVSKDDDTDHITSSTTTTAVTSSSGHDQTDDKPQEHEPVVVAAAPEKKSHSGFSFITSALPDSVQSLFSSKKTTTTVTTTEMTDGDKTITATKTSTQQSSDPSKSSTFGDDFVSDTADAYHRAFDRIEHDLRSFELSDSKQPSHSSFVETISSKQTIGGLSPEHSDYDSAHQSVTALRSDILPPSTLDGKSSDAAADDLLQKEFHHEKRVIIESHDGKTHGHVFENSSDQKSAHEMDFEFIH